MLTENEEGGREEEECTDVEWYLMQGKKGHSMHTQAQS